MSGLGNNAMGLQHDKKGILNCPSSFSEMANDSVSTMAEPSNAANPFLAASSSAWDPLVSLSQAHCEFANSLYPLVLENHQGMSSTSHLVVQYMPDSSFGDMIPDVSSYGNGSFLQMIGSFGQQPVLNNEQSQGEGSTPEEGDSGSAPCGSRRKRGLDYNSNFSPNKSAEGDVTREQDEKKPKVVQNTSAPVHSKQLEKQNQENSHSGEAPKENFIHVRARRGHATNSHSLAERVRREKISERMRVLQELVPGCSKITGKAVMLDEIINYVQSLQQQVEFLSMKLATVNPEVNIDLERILSKDILQSRIGHGPIGPYGSHPFPTPSFQGTLAAMPTASTQLPPFPQVVLDHEFQSLYGMSYDPSTSLHNMGPNGRLKSEL